MSTPFTEHHGIVVPIDAANIDTDSILPKQFLQKVTRSGFGEHLFHDWRYLDAAGTLPDPHFILNTPPYRAASILLTRENFGCGSSREHAPWALLDYGIRVIIASGFADIFYSNAFNNQLLLVTLPEPQTAALFTAVTAAPGIRFTVSLLHLHVIAAEKHYPFTIDPFRRHCMLNGLDNIGLTLQHQKQIAEWENQQPVFLR